MARPLAKPTGRPNAQRRGPYRAGARIKRHPITKWKQFVEIIEGWPGFRNWAFRGQADSTWPLESALTRHTKVADVCQEAWPEQEKRIRRIFRRKSHLFLDDPPGDDELEWLALMQHHGTPTRLLDFTWSPYVAAFFALERASSDAAVWAINLPLLWNLHDRARIDGVKVGDAHPSDLEVFDRLFLPNKHRFVWQGDPFRMPQRVVAQSGTFLVLGHLGHTLESILEGYPASDTLLVQFVFDRVGVRAEAMASLYSMNITQATLFPGLDGLARSMAYEFEYSWEYELKTNRRRESILDPSLPPGLLA